MYDTLAISGGGDESFVKNAYKSLFGRDGESEGVSFWSNALKDEAKTLENKSIALDEFLKTFINIMIV